MSDNQLIIATAQFDFKDWTQLLRNYQNLLSKCKEQRQKSPHEKILHALQTSVLFWLPTAFWSLPVFAMTNRWQNARVQWPQRRMRRHLREYVLLEDDDGRPPRNNFRLPEGCIAGRKSRYGLPSPYCRLEARTWKLSIWQTVTGLCCGLWTLALYHQPFANTRKLQKAFWNPKIFSHVFILMAIIAKWT